MNPLTPRPASKLEELKLGAASMKAKGWIRENGQAVPLQKLDSAVAALDGIRCQFLKVTPEQATIWLRNNVKNRKLRPETVQSFARDMASGNWLVTHQGVAFNDKDELIDGQHRLNAVIASGVAVTLLVTFGLPSSLLGKKVTTMDAVDRGTMRTIADQLAMEHGLTDASLVNGVCQGLSRICLGTRKRGKVTVAMVLEIFELYKESIKYVCKNRSKLPGLRTSGVLAAVAFAHAVEGAKVEVLFGKLNTGENLGGGDPILALRNTLMASEIVKNLGSTRAGAAETVLHAFYYALTGQTGTIGINRYSEQSRSYFIDQQKATVAAIVALFDLPKAERVVTLGTPVEVAPVKENPSVQKILSRVETQFGVAEIFLRGRKRELVPDIEFPRNVVFLISHFFGHGLEEIARVMKCTPDDVQFGINSLNGPLTPKEQSAIAKLKAKLV